ncbi:siderophore-interacting protein [Winogradskya humida]|uniref:Siderophore-interacting protein n=1 Tax=Winogradskya humida TaxID=113566 RepID=A0ABQ3ZW57_9ACTN|nr:siderophore-interacting protein [Actinoplanes humidus]GIE22835.1 siderophore-interacting protein [Actinoplanes humidus]
MAAVVEATVVAVQELSPSFKRITFAGCSQMSSGGYDQRIKILLARPGQDGPRLPEESDWYGSWLAMPEDERPIMRTFTIRSQDGPLVDIEFALHGDAGPASAWARAARPGSKLGIIGPGINDEINAVAYAPSEPDPEWHLLVGDDTAIPAIASILESLPPGAAAHVFVQVPHAGDVRDLPCAGRTQITWTIGHGLADAVRGAEFPTGNPYAWVAGESAVVRDVRRYLCSDRGWDSKSHYFGGYWKAGQPG